MSKSWCNPRVGWIRFNTYGAARCDYAKISEALAIFFAVKEAISRDFTLVEFDSHVKR